MGKCYNSTVVDSSIENTWKTIRDFHNLGWAAPVVEHVEKVGEVAGDQPGAKRVLNGVFHETLVSLDDKLRRFSYSIDDGPGPVAKGAVSDYVGVVELYPVTDTGQTMVVWASTYQSDSNEAVGALCNPIYQAVLAALKANLNP